MTLLPKANAPGTTWFTRASWTATSCAATAPVDSDASEVPPPALSVTAPRTAFEYFNGVCQVIVPDNASTASNQISRYEKTRDVNQSYAAFLEHYQCAAAPTRAASPQEKGNVEAGVKVVTNWVIHYLADRRFASLDELNEAVAEQVEMINDRTPFRGEARSRRAWFREAERAELMDLPEHRWQQVEWRKAKVSRDWHVQVDTAKYSVPHQHAGQVLDVRIVG
ncbi:hypothetical protein [Paenarthrobacter sp. PH39-S1]|uniref:Mu transposase domain-containing protein n=1 Tax=Paenarthrobacter sp. PH39-S1 TaxID=3046204 RepID=UPI0024BA7FFB|nr:hypothetical protein [Paenarthrobacter sp. PH39-S1]MDJ0356397.1 hypothetical protein [Paenarthrobacter sp. PH39-S1]